MGLKFKGQNNVFDYKPDTGYAGGGMPLMKGKSQKAFAQNVKTEMENGHPQKQSLAIAYSMKRKGKKMAKGGVAKIENDEMKDGYNHASPGNYNEEESIKHRTSAEHQASGFVSHEGNDVKHNMPAMQEDDKDLNQHKVDPHDSLKDDLVDRIMRKMSPDFSGEARLSKGGQVANDTHPFEEDFEDPNEFDDLVLRDSDMEGADYTGANSGDEFDNKREDEDRKDIVARIMASRRKKDRNPSPA